jgi:hypothetical protein
MAVKKAPVKKWEPKVVRFTVKLGAVWGDKGDRERGEYDEDYDAEVKGTKDEGRKAVATLKVGCHEFASKAAAERHWKDGISRESKKERPHAAALIAWADKEFKARGYKW